MDNVQPLTIEGIGRHIAELAAELKSKPTQAGFFRIRTANRCLEDAKTMPIPDQLFHSLIFEGELTILVADTNVGKSIFAVQIGDHIARNGRKVLYIDLELSDKQFERRYSEDFTNHYQFHPDLLRVDFTTRFQIPEGCSYDDYFIESLINSVEQSSAKVVIIDNMTRLISTDTDSAKNAKPLMDRLNQLKADYGLTLLLLEHTKKTDNSRPISLNDLQGSKMKANFADAVFTIGRSEKDKALRYVKQLKVRSCEFDYDVDNVIVYEIAKEVNNLRFSFVGYGSEWEHLKRPSDDDKDALIERAKELKAQGMSNVAIAKDLGMSEGWVRKWLKR